MKIYDTLIVGSGYFSVGYAIKNKNVIIIEEHQTCDVNFYLPLKSFKYNHYEPVSAKAKELYSLYLERNIFNKTEQNVNAFEGAFCKFIYENNVDVLLKTRMVRISKTPNGVFDVTVQSNEGLTHIFAKQIINTINKAQKNYYTTLFISNDIACDKKALLSVFDGAEFENTFYPDRFALHIPISNTNENLIKLFVYEKWNSCGTKAKIVYMAPVFYSTTATSAVCDDYYDNPIRAFEAGYLYKGEAL